jgi:hypothetical protein
LRHCGGLWSLTLQNATKDTYHNQYDPSLTLFRQAKALQASLLEIVDRVEIVRSQHEKLEGGNKFLQS